MAKLSLFLAGLLLPALSYASFIETTIGTAVVNDATAAYFNPAAMVLVKNTQIIPLGTVARFQTEFSGQTTFVPTQFMETGTSSSVSNYYSPSLYFAIPIYEKFRLGLAVVTNFANRNPEEGAILRYTQSSNTIQDYDIVPSVGVEVNNILSLGAGINFSNTDFHLHPISGFPGSNLADSESNNQSDGWGIGANIGFLLRPAFGSLIGFDYRTVTTYNERGKSTLNGIAPISSDNYRFQMRTPARGIFSISQLITDKLGLITTIQRIQWGIIKNIHASGIAATFGRSSAIINASLPFHLHNSWVLTFGANYKFNSDWIGRLAATYNQSPEDGYYQVSTGDSYVLGGSVGYQVNKTLTIDGSYAHAFMRNQVINITGNRFLIDGDNRGSRDVVSLKLTFNV